eukprot:TRINITY_DN14546_c0_g1_i1.p2 TRINITY_DN14546_c0_g1~~TRINITY_DN14546_c0_g1_i1.p2  ORF type:complete len:412 (+),score=103.22 TRINITY_DN14546_c0_g1_i1:119-1354(+)
MPSLADAVFSFNAVGAAVRGERGGPGLRRVVLVVGLGDSGVAAAVQLAKGERCEVVGITPHACHCSAQEVGGRLAQPGAWRQVYVQGFDMYKQLDGVRVVQGMVSAVDTARQVVSVTLPDGSSREEAYDALLWATGCTNGFWRPPPAFRAASDIDAMLEGEQAAVAAARTVAVVGGGPSGVSAAYNLAARHPSKAVHLFMSGDRPLPGYHPRTVAAIEAKLRRSGVVVHTAHRADASAAPCDALTGGAVSWTTGQPPFPADLVVWAVGRVAPNTAALPRAMLTERRFVDVDPYLRVCRDGAALPNVFAVGDVAATDPARTSARNNGWALVARNIEAVLQGRAGALEAYVPPVGRWGSILGPWDGGAYEVYFQNGRCMALPLRVWNWCWPLVQRFLWGGMRSRVDWMACESG